MLISRSALARFSMPSAMTDSPSCRLSPMVEPTMAASSAWVSRSGASDGNREFVAAQTRDETGAIGLRDQPVGDGAQHEIAAGMTLHVVDVLKAVVTDHQQCDLARQLIGRGNHGG